MKKLANYKLDIELIKKIQTVAAAEGRSATGLVAWVMGNYCDSKLPPQIAS